MDPNLMIALLSFLGTALGTITGLAINTKLSNYRIEQLEKKVEKHNNLIERTYEAEENIKVIKKDIEYIKEDIKEIKK